MADQGTASRGQASLHRDSPNSSSQGQDKLDSQIGKISESAKGASEQALAAGRDIKDKAAELAGSSSDAIKARASDLVDAAKDVASQATDQLKEKVEGQKVAGAEYVNGIAEAMRRAAREFEGPVPIAASYMLKAAAQVQGVSESIKSGDVNDIVRNAQTFARRQPTAFFGIAALAGFGLVRFLKSSSGHSEAAGMSDVSRDQGRTQRVSNARYRDDFSK